MRPLSSICELTEGRHHRLRQTGGFDVGVVRDSLWWITVVRSEPVAGITDSLAVFVADAVPPEERDRIYEDLATTAH
jgi:hypothetical protein